MTDTRLADLVTKADLAAAVNTLQREIRALAQQHAPVTKPVSKPASNGAASTPHKETPPRRGYKLVDAFKILGISEATGRKYARDKKINIVRLGPRLPLVTQDEIDRIMRDGIE